MILYIGNKLSKHGFTPTSVETLGAKLQEQFEVLLVSDKKNTLLRFLDAIFTIVKNRKKIRLVLIDTYSTNNFYYALISALLCHFYRLPFIPILHGGGLPDRLKSSPYLSKLIFAKAIINVSPSHYLQRAFTECGFNVIYIPNYIDINLYPARVRSKAQPKLLYVRSFHKIYNPEMAIKVLKRLSRKYSNVELCMVGPDKDGGMEIVKKLASELDIADHLKLTGKLSKEKWIALAAEYDIFINTTNFDNLPVSVIEAMCLGFPIVSTNAGGLPYLIKNGENGILIEKNDDDEMAKKIEEIIQNPEFTLGLSTKAIEKGQTFDWKKIKSKWVELIDAKAKSKH